mmetsp:Transcript_5161/g.7878  ORF Transcript_5161/g.7878 Transcript_5161/m.7878 type:complete len:236 (-) Transcript_5161:83-790(-)
MTLDVCGCLLFMLVNCITRILVEHTPRLLDCRCCIFANPSFFICQFTRIVSSPYSLNLACAHVIKIAAACSLGAVPSLELPCSNHFFPQLLCLVASYFGLNDGGTIVLHKTTLSIESSPAILDNYRSAVLQFTGLIFDDSNATANNTLNNNNVNQIEKHFHLCSVSSPCLLYHHCSFILILVISCLCHCCNFFPCLAGSHALLNNNDVGKSEHITSIAPKSSPNFLNISGCSFFL